MTTLRGDTCSACPRRPTLLPRCPGNTPKDGTSSHDDPTTKKSVLITSFANLRYTHKEPPYLRQQLSVRHSRLPTTATSVAWIVSFLFIILFCSSSPQRGTIWRARSYVCLRPRFAKVPAFCGSWILWVAAKNALLDWKVLLNFHFRGTAGWRFETTHVCE